jgi:hypothetical protein
MLRLFVIVGLALGRLASAGWLCPESAELCIENKTPQCVNVPASIEALAPFRAHCDKVGKEQKQERCLTGVMVTKDEQVYVRCELATLEAKK